MELVYKKILVAVDGSKDAEKAFKKAIQIAKRNDTKLLLAHIIDPRSYTALGVYTYDTPLVAYDPTIVEKYENSARDLLEKYIQEGIEAGIKNLNFVIERGSPKKLISKDIPDKNKVDLIICGATGLNAVERFMVGSVSEYTVRHAKCDVLLVRS